MEDDHINSEADSEFAATVRELAAMSLPGYPSTDRAWLNLVKRDEWRFREVQGKGRGGVHREYIPPPSVMALIEARRRGETGEGDARGGFVVDEKTGVKRYFAEKKSPPSHLSQESGVIRCSCGHLVGIQANAKVRLAFTAPDPISFMRLGFSVRETQAAKGMDAKNLYDLTLLCFSVLALMSEGNEAAFDKIIEDDDTIEKLAAFVLAYHDVNHSESVQPGQQEGMIRP